MFPRLTVGIAQFLQNIFQLSYPTEIDPQDLIKANNTQQDAVFGQKGIVEINMLSNYPAWLYLNLCLR